MTKHIVKDLNQNKEQDSEESFMVQSKMTDVKCVEVIKVHVERGRMGNFTVFSSFALP